MAVDGESLVTGHGRWPMACQVLRRKLRSVLEALNPAGERGGVLHADLSSKGLDGGLQGRSLTSRHRLDKASEHGGAALQPPLHPLQLQVPLCSLDLALLCLS